MITKNKKTNNTPGFTLVELLVSLTIVGVLVGITLVSFRGARAVARDGQRKTELEEIRSALEIYRADQGVYPTTGEGLALLVSRDYMSEVVDPLSPTYDYRYESIDDGITYTLCTFLEAGGPGATCTGECGTSTPCNYGVVNP